MCMLLKAAADKASHLDAQRCVSDASPSLCFSTSCNFAAKLTPSLSTAGASDVRVGALPVPCHALIFFTLSFCDGIVITAKYYNRHGQSARNNIPLHSIQMLFKKKKKVHPLCADVWSPDRCGTKTNPFGLSSFFYMEGGAILGRYLMRTEVLSLKYTQGMNTKTCFKNAFLLKK